MGFVKHTSGPFSEFSCSVEAATSFSKSFQIGLNVAIVGTNKSFCPLLQASETRQPISGSTFFKYLVPVPKKYLPHRKMNVNQGNMKIAPVFRVRHVCLRYSVLFFSKMEAYILFDYNYRTGNKSDVQVGR